MADLAYQQMFSFKLHSFFCFYAWHYVCFTPFVDVAVVQVMSERQLSRVGAYREPVSSAGKKESVVDVSPTTIETRKSSVTCS
jgi:hypothetical protein